MIISLLLATLVGFVAGAIASFRYGVATVTLIQNDLARVEASIKAHLTTAKETVAKVESKAEAIKDVITK